MTSMPRSSDAFSSNTRFFTNSGLQTATTATHVTQ